MLKTIILLGALLGAFRSDATWPNLGANDPSIAAIPLVVLNEEPFALQRSQECAEFFFQLGVNAQRLVGNPPFPIFGTSFDTWVGLPDKILEFEGVLDTTENTENQFIRNHKEGLMWFSDWFLGYSGLPFKKMLEKHHLIACLGADGNTPYQSHSPDTSYSTHAIYPGKMRNAPSLPSYLMFASAELEVTKEQAMNILHLHSKPVNLGRAQWKLSLPMLEKDESNDVVINAATGWVVSFYPRESEALESYIRAAEQLMILIQSTRWLRMKNKTVRRNWYIDLLADYYQLLLAATPFTRVNDSIFMEQINYLLRFQHFSTLPHRHLWQSAAVLDSANFRKVFRYLVYRYNDWIPEETRLPASAPPFWTGAKRVTSSDGDTLLSY